jgi:fibronectin type 3 domain-containing protein
MAFRRSARYGCLTAYCILALCACAKISEPVPPQPLVPRPAGDLAVRQIAQSLRLTFSMPELNTNGSRVSTLGEVEIFRWIADRAATEPLSEDAFLARAERIQTWRAETLGSRLKDGKLFFDDSFAADAEAFVSHAYRYAVRLINKKNQTAGLSHQVVITPAVIPAAPDEITAVVERNRIRLTWKAPEINWDGSMPARLAGYRVYRSLDPKNFPEAPYGTDLLHQPEFDDRNFEFDKTYYYRLTVVGNPENPHAESLPSTMVEVIATDTFPPGMPSNLAAVPENGVVTLLWGAPADQDIAGYRVYRKEEGAGTRVLLNESLVTGLSFRDTSVLAGKKYEYGVAAVDTHRNEGPAAGAIVEVK